MRQKVRTWQAKLDRSCRRRRFHDAVATGGAGELGPHMPNHLVAGWNPLQLFRHIFPEFAQLAPAIGTALVWGKMRNDFTRQIFRQWLATWSCGSTLLPGS